MTTAPSPVASETPSSRILSEEALARIKALRVSSMGLLATGGSVAADAMKAMWEMILSIVRAVARMMGIKTSSRPTQEAPAKDAPKDDIPSSAEEVNSLMQAGSQLPEGKSSAFFQALDYAGVTDAALEFLQNPDEFAALSAPQSVMAAALGKASTALNVLSDKKFEVMTERCKAAFNLGKGLQPPVLVEDLVVIYRQRLAQGRVPETEKADALKLMAADDNLAKIVTHVTTIKDTVVIAANCAIEHGASLDGQKALFERVLGPKWTDMITQTKLLGMNQPLRICMEKENIELPEEDISMRGPAPVM